MRTQRILDLVKIVEAHEIDEIEISRLGTRIRITKSKTNPQVPYTRPADNFEVVSRAPISAPIAAESAPNPSAASKPANQMEIKSPMVGTFYRAPAPDADPYVRVGDHIHSGQPLCIIEAMKIMNVIESETAGKIVNILVENAQPVEFNQTLFVIEKS